MSVLVGHQLGLSRQRERVEVVGKVQQLEPDARLVQLAGVERIAAMNVPQEPQEPTALKGGQGDAVAAFGGENVD